MRTGHGQISDPQCRTEQRGGAFDVFGRGYSAVITRLVEGACIELAVTGGALGGKKVRVELRFTPEGTKTGRLTAYFWKAPKGAALDEALWESHGAKLFDAFRKRG